MKSHKNVFERCLSLLTALLVVFTFSVQAGSSVWKVTKGDNKLYLGGTIHVLSKSDYPLPAPFEQAYQQSARIVLETDMQKVQSPEFQQAMLQAMMYSDGRDLRQVLSKETYQSLSEFSASRGIPLDRFTKFKPGMVSLVLTISELQRLGFVGTGVDEYFSLKAVKDHKPLGQLETAEAQLAFLSQMGEGQEDEMIAYTLRDIKQLPEQMTSMKDGWRRGDMALLDKVALTPLKKEFPDVYQSLLVTRNNAWLPQIEAMLKNQEVELVLVGALHLVGEDGLLAQLEDKGYEIHKL